MQAFRFMSHKFHGRGSGKRKQERRIKKIQDEHVCVWRGVVRCLKGSAILLSEVNTVMLQLYVRERICKNKPCNLLIQSLLMHSIWSPCLIFTFKHNINFNEARVSCMCLILHTYVAVLCRNQRLFRCVFRLHRCIQSAISLNFH